MALILFATLLLAADEPGKSDDSIAVVMVGKLTTREPAKPGETTGALIASSGITWELDFGHDDPTRAAAATLNDKQVEIRGTLAKQTGVENRERWIVSVTSLRAAGRPPSLEGGASAGEAKGSDDDGLSLVEWNRENGAVEIRSKKGIGRATLNRPTEVWPKRVIVRLHLTGMELFSASNGEKSIEWSASSTGGGVRVTLRQRKEEQPLTSDSPFYTAVRITGDGKIPLAKGYFEVMLPSKLLEANPANISLHWIDFYRG